MCVFLRNEELNSEPIVSGESLCVLGRVPSALLRQGEVSGRQYEGHAPAITYQAAQTADWQPADSERNSQMRHERNSWKESFWSRPACLKHSGPDCGARRAPAPTGAERRDSDAARAAFLEAQFARSDLGTGWEDVL